MADFHLHRRPRKKSWWQKQWDSFKSNFPDRSGKQARSFLLSLAIFVLFLVFTRLFFASQGVPI